MQRVYRPVCTTAAMRYRRSSVVRHCCQPNRSRNVAITIVSREHGRRNSTLTERFTILPAVERRMRAFQITAVRCAVVALRKGNVTVCVELILTFYCFHGSSYVPNGRPNWRKPLCMSEMICKSSFEDDWRKKSNITDKIKGKVIEKRAENVSKER